MIALPVPPHCPLTSAGPRSALFGCSVASSFCLFALFAGFSHARGGSLWCGSDDLTQQTLMLERLVEQDARSCKQRWEVCACLEPWLRTAPALMCHKRRLNKSGADSEAESPANRTSSGNFQTGAPSAFTLGWYPKLNKDLPQHFYCPALSLRSEFVCISRFPAEMILSGSLWEPYNISSSIKNIWFIGWDGQRHDNIWKHCFLLLVSKSQGTKTCFLGHINVLRIISLFSLFTEVSGITCLWGQCDIYERHTCFWIWFRKEACGICSEKPKRRLACSCRALP